LTKERCIPPALSFAPAPSLSPFPLFLSPHVLMASFYSSPLSLFLSTPSTPTPHPPALNKLYSILKKKKWTKELNKEFSTEEYRMAEKHLKKCSKSLVIKEM